MILENGKLRIIIRDTGVLGDVISEKFAENHVSFFGSKIVKNIKPYKDYGIITGRNHEVYEIVD